jgi:hypothetical protein
MAMFRNWRRPLTQVILLVKPDSGHLRSLRCAWRYISTLPTQQSDRSEWRSAVQLLRVAAAKKGECEAATRQIRFALLLNGALDVPPPRPPASATGREWSDRDINELRGCLAAGISMMRVADFLSRSVSEVTSKAVELGFRPPPSGFGDDHNPERSAVGQPTAASLAALAEHVRSSLNARLLQKSSLQPEIADEKYPATTEDAMRNALNAAETLRMKEA